MDDIKLTKRWSLLRPHAKQNELWNCQSRFVVVPAGRRSGKTELAKRMVVREAISHTEHANARFVCAAPTRDQAKRIYWDDLKSMVPRALQTERPSETELSIKLYNGARILVVGMDAPERIEGVPLDGIVCDEYANMKPEAWTAHIRPALSDRTGWAWFIGVPEGRNHYYDLYNNANQDDTGTWSTFHWISSDILPHDEIESAKRDMDELTYLQEYEASFVSFEGQAYYPFDRETHCSEETVYDPNHELIFCFDFNVSPGIAVVCQQHGDMTHVVGEVYIPRNSNTPAVCKKLIEDWGEHKAEVAVYGDATGGAAGSAKVQGSDWDLVRQHLRPQFKGNLRVRVPKQNPKERIRVNAVNARLKSAAEIVSVMIDPTRCPEVIKDLEGVKLLEGGSGEIDKKYDTKLTHLTDALGYYLVRRFSLYGKREMRTEQI